MAEPTIKLPDAAFLLHGELSQAGFDLVLDLADGRQHVVHDYFSFSPQPTLIADTGAALTPTLVRSFLPRSFGEDLLFAGPANATGALVEIGRVTMLVGDVTVRRLDGSEAKLARGDIIYQGDVVITSTGSFVKAEMLDGTRFQLGQNGEAAFDDFEFDEAQGSGEFSASVRIGGFYYKSGKIGELDSTQSTVHTTIRTPTSIIGVRGSELEGLVDASGTTTIVHRSGILDISDVNGNGAVTLLEPGNTSTIVFNAAPVFLENPPPQLQQALSDALPPPDSDTESGDEEDVSDGMDEGDSEDNDSADNQAVENNEEEVSSETVSEGDAPTDSEEGEDSDQSEEGTASDGTEDQIQTSESAGTDSLEIDNQASVSSGSSETSTSNDVLEEIETELASSQSGQGSVSTLSVDEAAEEDTIETLSTSSPSSELQLVESQSEVQSLSLPSEDSDSLDTLSVSSTQTATTLEIEATQLPVQETQEESPPPPPEPVIPPDNPPVAEDDDLAISEATLVDVTDLVLANDDDPDANQTLTIVSAVSDRDGAVSVSEGRLTFTPDESLLTPLAGGETATETITYTVTSGDLSATATITIRYEGVNDAPSIAPAEISVAQDDEIEVITTADLLAQSLDPDDSDVLVVENLSLASGDEAGISINEEGALVIDPSAYSSLAEGESASANYRFDVVELDDEGNELSRTNTTATINILGANDAAVVGAVTSEAGEDDAIYVLDLLTASTDPDASNQLVVDNISLRSGDPAGILINDDGTLTVDPTAYDALSSDEQSVIEYGYEVIERDASGNELSRTENSATITIVGANDAAVVGGVTFTASEDDDVVVIDLLSESSDADLGDTLTVANILLVNGNDQGVLVNANGTLELSPTAYAELAAGETVTIEYQYDVVERDPSGQELGRETTSAVLTLNGENDEAVTGDVTFTVGEDDTSLVIEPSDLLAASSDVDATDQLSIENLSLSAGDEAGILVGQDGSLSVDPNAYTALAAGESSSVQYQYDVVERDALGTELGRNSVTATITITGANDAAVVGDTAVVVNEDAETLLISPEDLLASSLDVDQSNELSVENIELADGDASGITLAADQSVTVDPSAYGGLATGESSVVQVSFDVVERDQNGTELSRTPATASITIEGANDAAIVEPVQFEANEDAALQTLNLLDASSDVDQSNLLVVENVILSAGDDVGLTINADGTLTVDPEAYTSLPVGATTEVVYAFDVVELSAAGEELSRTATTATIVISGENDPAAFTLEISDGQVTQGAAFDSVARGSIAVLDPDQGQSVIVSAEAAYGEVTIVDGQFEYVVDPTLNLTETTIDTIVFTSVDGSQTPAAIFIYTENSPALLNIVVDTQGQEISAGGGTVTGSYTLQDAEGAILLNPQTQYGLFSQTISGPPDTDGVTSASWTYVVDANNPAVLGLDAGESLVEVVVFRTDDARDINGDLVVLDIESETDGDDVFSRADDVIEGEQRLEFVIQGQNDPPVIGWSTLVTDQNNPISLGADEGLLIYVVDPDNADGSITDAVTILGTSAGTPVDGAPLSAPGVSVAGRYGTLTISADGALQYVADPTAQALALENALFVDDEVFSVSVSDGSETVQAELIIEIRNPPPQLVSTPLQYLTVSGDLNLSVTFEDLDAFTVQVVDRQTLGGLPNGLTSTLTTDGQTFVGTNLSSATITLTNGEVSLSSTNGDWLLGVSADDGDNVPVIEQFVLAIRSPEILYSNLEVYEFFAGEKELVAGYAATSLLDISLWEPEEGDRFVSLTAESGSISVALYGNEGVTVTLDSPNTVIFPDNAAQDVVTLTGTLTDLQVIGAQSGDVLVANADIVIGSTPDLPSGSSVENPFELQVGATFSVNSSGEGTQAGFTNASDGVVGVTQAAPVSFDVLAVLSSGYLEVVTDDQPAAPVLVSGSLTNDGRIFLSGQAALGPDQPVLLQVSTTASQSGLFSQSTSGETMVSSGAGLQVDSFENEGTLRLVASLDDGTDTGSLADDQFSIATVTVSGNYLEQGRLISQASNPPADQAASHEALAAPNRVDVDRFELGPEGRIQVDHDLSFINANQTLDWRQGDIVVAPSSTLTVSGGEVILGEDSLVSGYGQLNFGSQTSVSSEAILISIDGSLNTNQFQGEVNFDGAVTLSSLAGSSQLATLTVSPGDELTFAGDDQVNVLVTNHGEIEFTGRGNQISQTVTNALGGVFELRLDATQALSSVVAPVSEVFFDGVISNEGLLVFETSQMASSPSNPSALIDPLMMTFGQSSVSNAANSAELVNAGRWIIQEDFGGSEAGFWFGNTDVVTITVNANVTNSGVIELIDGQVIVNGSVSNSGTIEVQAPRSDDGAEVAQGGFDNPRGGQLSITGDLTLSPTSVLSLSVGGSASQLFLMGLSVDGLIQTDGTTNTAQDLGGLALDFFPATADDPISPSELVSWSSMYERFGGQSDFEWVLSTNVESGSEWSAVSSNLPAGYELSLRSDAGTAAGTSTTSVVVSDGFEVRLDGNQTATPTTTDDVLVLVDTTVGDGEVLSLRSFSLEGQAGSVSLTPVTLSVASGGSLVTTHQSGVFHGQQLILEASVGSSALLDIGADLVVAGSLILQEGAMLQGSGSVRLAPSGEMSVDAATIDVDVVNAGELVLTSTTASSAGFIDSTGWIVWLPGATDAAVHVGIDNHGVIELRSTSGESNQFVLSGESISGLGMLGMAATQAHLDNPTLSTEVELVIDSGVLDAARMTLQLFGPLSGTTISTLSAGTGGSSTLNLSDQTVFRAIEIDGFGQAYGGVAVLRVEGDWVFELDGMVELQFPEEGAAVPVLDASTAVGVQLVASSTEPVEFINHGTMLVHDLRVATDVVLANVGDEGGINVDQGRLALSGASLIEGDFYNVDYGQLFLEGEVRVSGQLVTDFTSVIHLGANVSMLDAAGYAGTLNQSSSLTAPSASASITFAQDVLLQGELMIYDLVGDGVVTLTVGDATMSGQLENEGHIVAGVMMPQQTGGGENAAVIRAQLGGSGDLTVLGDLTLDGQGSVAHQVTGLVTLGQYEDAVLGSSTTAATLTLGAGDQLLVGEGGRLVTDAANVQTLQLVASDSQLVIEGSLDVGGADDGILNLEGSGELVLDATGELLMDANLVSGNSDQVLTSSSGTSELSVLLSGGRLVLNLASSPAVQSSVTLVAAPLILGAFSSVDGLVIDAGTGLVADIELLTETSSGLDEINIVAVDASMVAVGVADTADRFDFLTSTNITHFVGDTSATNTDDLIQNIGLGQTAYGEVGDDTFMLASMEFRRIDGGAGIDTVVMPAGGVLDGEGFITFDFRMTTDGQGFWGMRLDRIEVIDLNDGDESTKHRIHLDAEAIAGLNDGGNELIDGQSGIVVRGQLGDQIDLYGDFTFIEDTFLSVSRLGVSTVSPGSPAEVEQSVERFTHLAHNGQSIMVDGSIYVVVHEADGGKSQFGTSASEAVTGTDQAETLHGRDGDDVIDGLLGSDQIDGGRGSDQIVFDVADTAVDGGLGIDTLLVSGSIDLSNIDGLDTAANLQNFEVISMAGNETADVLNLEVADVIDWVEDNSLEVLGAGNGHRMLVIRGDAEDQLSLDGIDINALSAIESDIDLFGDGSLFSLFRDELLGIDIYVDQALLSGDETALTSDSLTPLSRSTVGLLDDMMPLSSDSSDGWM